LRRPLGNDGTKRDIERFLTICGLLPIDEGVVRKALSLPGNDFEDNIKIACSQIYPIDLIVTRNPGDFMQGVMVPVIDPKEILRYLPQANP
jgi:hypothetical protein